jgi:hypothetical protein
MQKTLLNQTNAVIKTIAAGSYQEARDQLKDDILGKTDGCATQGNPDQNDWIKDCATQQIVYSSVFQTINLLQGLQ